MPWYKISGNHGPGHQSTSTEYWWRDEILTKEWVEELENSFIEYMASKGYGLHFGGEMCGVKAEIVDTLPENVLKLKIMEYRGSLRYSRKMLKILGVSEDE